jgi:Leucine rich repeat
MDIFCEEIQTRHVDHIEIIVQSCRLDQLTNIDSAEVAFAFATKPMTVITELYFDYNIHIHFLPIKTGEKFPNLISLSAWFCGIKAVSKANFMQLTKLQRLAINNNRIEAIDGDTFEDLIELKWLFLDSNRIATFNGNDFKVLPNLLLVNFERNFCIDRIFNEQTEITEMYQFFPKQCAKKSDIEKSELEKSDVEKADVEKADVEKADVEKADVEKADVEKADVEKSDAEK